MRGVRDSAIFILVLSKSVFTRPFCRLEIMTALEARKPFVTLFETDARFGKFDFGAPTEGVPDAFHPIIAKITSGVCADPLRRSHDENELMVNHIARKHIEGRGHVLDVPAHILAEADAPGSSVTVASVPALKMSSSAAETAAHATMREALSAMERYAQEVGGGHTRVAKSSSSTIRTQQSPLRMRVLARSSRTSSFLQRRRASRAVRAVWTQMKSARRTILRRPPR